ncbi:MAG: FAD-binding protein, partial [Myxococcota bacterium]
MMTRNLWGWGAVEAAVSLEETQARIEPFFGASEVRSPVEPKVPRARVALPAELRAFSAADDHARAGHAMGKAYPDRVRGFRGDFSSAPDIVATPADERELLLTLEVAERERLAVTPFGGGSSVVGGVEPRLGPGHRGSLSLDLSRLSRVHEIDEVSLVARIGAGAFGPALEQQLGARGLTLRHYPQSFEFSTL